MRTVKAESVEDENKIRQLEDENNIRYQIGSVRVSTISDILRTGTI
jgi:hypothetical protein